MATLKQCERAVQHLADRLAEVDPDLRNRYAADRTVACRVSDLGCVFHGRVSADGLQDVHVASDDHAAKDDDEPQIRLVTTSDDLLALAEGRLAVPTAWATGRLKVEASVLDLLKLRSLL